GALVLLPSLVDGSLAQSNAACQPEHGSRLRATTVNVARAKEMQERPLTVPSFLSRCGTCQVKLECAPLSPSCPTLKRTRGPWVRNVLWRHLWTAQIRSRGSQIRGFWIRLRNR